MPEKNQEPPPSGLTAVLTARCPDCRRGPIFTHSVASHKFINVHKECPHCGCNYEPEPGFFWGAMYINYGFNIATMVAVSVALYVLFGIFADVTHIIAIILTIVVTVPLTSRASRILMLHWFGPFKFRDTLFHKGKSARSAQELKASR